MALGTRAFIGLTSLLAASGMWLTSCALNPQPEPPMEQIGSAGGSGGTMYADAGMGGSSMGGASGSAGMSQGGAGGAVPFADASIDACNGDDCKCDDNGDSGPCDATCERVADSDPSCELDGGCEASDTDATEPDSDPADVLSPD
jgi:hypothetical protein